MHYLTKFRLKPFTANVLFEWPLLMIALDGVKWTEGGDCMWAPISLKLSFSQIRGIPIDTVETRTGIPKHARNTLEFQGFSHDENTVGTQWTQTHTARTHLEHAQKSPNTL